MRRACCIGWPIAHARSPLIHGYWLREHGIDGDYGREGVPPAEFAGFFRGLEAHGYVGCNITLPHKEAAFALVDHVHPDAAAVGAVNTVWIEDGRFHGTNTDVPGFLANLDDHVPNWQTEAGHAVVIGAGGAARGIVHGLLSRGVPLVTVANRSGAKAEAIAALHPGRVRTLGLAELPRALPDADLLVNTTSLGMRGQPPLLVDLEGLKDSAIVSDIVYVPLETGLLRQAAARGLRTVGGLGMLLHQAVPGFARWFGVVPKVTPALHDLVAADVGKG